MTGNSHFSHDLALSRRSFSDAVSTPLLNMAGIGHKERAYLTVDMARSRLLLVTVLFFCAFFTVIWRLGDLTLRQQGDSIKPGTVTISQPPTHPRADITDRNGVLLATSLPVQSIYADPGKIVDPEHAAHIIHTIFPEMDRESLRARLTGKTRFAWIKRGLTPLQAAAVNRAGIPGIYFRREARRLYPQGRLTSHVTGFTDIDQSGLSGVERGLDERLETSTTPLVLSLDTRLQHILRQAMVTTMNTHQARGAAGLIMDVHSGELLSLVSLPDFDPNDRTTMTTTSMFNRATLGVYEMGSTFKPFTIAMALDAGTATLETRYDARTPISVSRFLIEDYRPLHRWLSLPEILRHSSNIGAAKMALDVGKEYQQDFFNRAGLFAPPPVEIAEVGTPIIPGQWQDVNVMTAGFGHGLAVSVLQLARATAAIANGGILPPVTFVKRETSTGTGNAQAPIHGEDAAGGVTPTPVGPRLISQATSQVMTDLLRDVVSTGTASKADVLGYRVGGKTGTAEKANKQGYAREAVVSSFVGIFPADRPQYLLMILFDEPGGTPETFNHVTGGWVAAPTAGRVISRIGPILGLAPQDPNPLPAPETGQLRQNHVQKNAVPENNDAPANGRAVLASF